MKNPRCFIVQFITLLVILSSLAATQSFDTRDYLIYTLEYDPSAVRTASPYVHISITLPEDTPEGPLQMVIPNAIPSDYETHPYDTFVGHLRAIDEDGNNLTVTKGSAGPVWRIDNPNSNSTTYRVKTIQYTSNVKQMEISILDGGDSSRIRTGYVGILGVSVFAYIEGLEEDRVIELDIVGPKDWPIFSTLAPQNPPQLHRMKACCQNFYELADSQIAMGPDMQIVKRTIKYLNGEKKMPVYLAVYAEGNIDMEKVGHLTSQAMEASLDFFVDNQNKHQDLFPAFTYFIQLIRPLSPLHYYGWSLEHLQSATIVYPDDEGIHSDSNSSVINRHLYNLVHHTLHAWIPKRCYGEHYYPFTWQIGPVFDSIWFAEGFVQYAAALVTQNLTSDPGLFFDCLLDRRFKSSLNSAPEFILGMDLIYLSYVASTQYSKDFRISSNLFSRGAMMAQEMDLMISAKTGGTRTIRDALKWVIGWTAIHKKPFRIEQIPSFFLTATGVDTQMIFEKWLKAPQSSYPYYVLPATRCDSIY